MKIWKHFCTITRHKMLVMKGCFQVGLIRQGLLHDLSKYSPREFFVGCRYYQGNRSPNDAEREAVGYSSAWLHHKGRNKHHLEYWLDYGIPGENSIYKGMSKGLCGMKMPVNYVVEMYVDRVAASKNYQKENYRTDSPLLYYERGIDCYFLHDDTKAMLELLFVMLAKKGERKTNWFIKHKILTNRVPYKKAVLDSIKAKL